MAAAIVFKHTRFDIMSGENKTVYNTSASLSELASGVVVDASCVDAFGRYIGGDPLALESGFVEASRRLQIS